MIPEDRAAKIVHRLLSPQSSFEQFERILVTQQRPDWNRAVAYVADEIREAGRDAKIGHDIDPDLAKEYDAEASVSLLALADVRAEVEEFIA